MRRYEAAYMPELPEVETMCRGIYPIIGKRIQSISTPPCAYRPIQMRPAIDEIASRLVGSKVAHVLRIGKRVVIQAGSESLILQPKMTGLVALDKPPDREHVRLQIEFSSRMRLQFWDSRGLGVVELLPSAELHERIVQGRLGPDALTITVDDFVSRMKATSRPIKVVSHGSKSASWCWQLVCIRNALRSQNRPNPACLSGERNATEKAASRDVGYSEFGNSTRGVNAVGWNLP